MAAKTSGYSVFLVATSIVLAILVLVLSSQNRALKQALAKERTAGTKEHAPSEARLVAGEVLPPLSLLARDGSVERLALDGTGQGALLMFYAENCTVCPQVFLSWEELTPQFVSEDVRVAAVQLDRTPSGAPYGPPGIESFALADFATVPLAKIATVPLTLLVDGHGVVRWAHYGTLTSVDMGALVELLPVPGG